MQSLLAFIILQKKGCQQANDFKKCNIIVKAYLDIMTSHKINPTFFKPELSFLSLTPKRLSRHIPYHMHCVENREQNYQSDQG